MLIECMEKIGEYRAVRALRAFLRSAWFLALVVLLMVLSNLFSLELPVFYLYLVLGLLIVLFGDDLFPLVPIVLCCYMAISYQNNPAMFPAGSAKPAAFYNGAFILQLTFLIAVAVLLIAARLIVILMRGEKKKVPALAVGFGALGLAYMIAGLFTRYYDFRTALFGFTQIISLCGLYFLFYYGVDWKKTEKDRFAFLFTILGLGIFAEVLWMYHSSGELSVILSGGAVDRGKLVTGWGMYNNVGCVMAICAPAPLYLAVTKKRGYLYILLSMLLFLGVIFTQSRGSILFGGIALVLGIVAMLVASKGRTRMINAVTVGALAALAVAALVVLLCVPTFKDAVKEVFAGIFKQGFGANGRWEIYEDGIEQFKEAPFFGVGFYQCNAFRWGDLPETAFLPPRYHDTYVQLLASGGVFALACYLLHRLETVVLLVRKPTLEKVFIAVSIAALLLTSITDCHFFNFGPGMLYGTLLAFAEGSDRARLQE